MQARWRGVSSSGPLQLVVVRGDWCVGARGRPAEGRGGIPVGPRGLGLRVSEVCVTVYISHYFTSHKAVWYVLVLTLFIYPNTESERCSNRVSTLDYTGSG